MVSVSSIPATSSLIPLQFALTGSLWKSVALLQSFCCPSAELLWLNHLLFTYKVEGFDKKSCLIILKFVRICMNISLRIIIQIMALFPNSL